MSTPEKPTQKPTQQQQTPTPAVTAVTPTPTPSPEVQQTLRELMNECVMLALEVLDNECNCIFYQHARKIAKLVKKLMMARGLPT